MSIIVMLLFQWILSPGYQPAGFVNGKYVGAGSAKPAIVEQYARR